jgi:hypothetical protein
VPVGGIFSARTDAKTTQVHTGKQDNLPRGVTVAQTALDRLAFVRIEAGQFFSQRWEKLFSNARKQAKNRMFDGKFDAQ